jgi:hypothetical protein
MASICPTYHDLLCLLQAQLLCKATYEGKLDRLSNLLRAGCAADAHDYDGQTALHVAAADANLPAVRGESFQKPMYMYAFTCCFIWLSKL